MRPGLGELDTAARRLQIVLYAAGALLLAVAILEARRRARD